MSYYVRHSRGIINSIINYKELSTDIEIDEKIGKGLLDGTLDVEDYFIENNEIKRVNIGFDESKEGFRILEPEPYTLSKHLKPNLFITPIVKKKTVVIQFNYKFTEELVDKAVILKIDSEEYPLLFDEFDSCFYLIVYRNLSKKTIFEIENKIEKVCLCPNLPIDVNFVEEENDDSEDDFVEIKVRDGFLVLPEEYKDTIGYIVNPNDINDILDYFLIEETLEASVVNDAILVINGQKIRLVPEED